MYSRRWIWTLLGPQFSLFAFWFGLSVFTYSGVIFLYRSIRTVFFYHSSQHSRSTQVSAPGAPLVHCPLHDSVSGLRSALTPPRARHSLSHTSSNVDRNGHLPVPPPGRSHSHLCNSHTIQQYRPNSATHSNRAALALALAVTLCRERPQRQSCARPSVA